MSNYIEIKKECLLTWLDKQNIQCDCGTTDLCEELLDFVDEIAKTCYQQGRADQLEEDKGKKWELMLIELGRKQGRADFIAEHTQINVCGKPFILISSEEYEQLKEQSRMSKNYTRWQSL